MCHAFRPKNTYKIMALILCMLTGTCATSNDTVSADTGLDQPPEFSNNGYDFYRTVDFDICHLDPYEDLLPLEIAKSIESGAKLIKYDVTFPDYDFDPLQENASFVYKPHLWQRVVGKHGKTLLSLAFNYDVLSLKMLTFGVEEKEVKVKDDPPFCFDTLDGVTKLSLIRELLLRDFRTHTEKTEYLAEDNYVCQQLITEDKNGYANFQYECCTRTEMFNGTIECTRGIEDKWIDLLYALIVALKVAFLLLGPLVLQKWVYHHSIRKADYSIKLSDTLRKTLVVKKIKVHDVANKNVVEGRKDFPGQFEKFKKIVKVLPSNEVVPVNISRLHIQVDHKDLIDEKSVPTGLLYFIWANFFQCGLMKYEPFLSCCRESIVGSWDSRFLWLKLFPEGSECNRSCRKYLSYGHLTNLLGGLILVAAVASPYFGRLAIYYRYEEPEIESRKDAIEALGLHERIGGNLFHYLTPSHAFCIVLYVFYFASFLLIAFYRKYKADTFEEIVLGSLQDLRSISRLGCIRLLLSHILLPFEKFGLCGGVLVACIYYIFAIPLCIITIIWYCIPTLYLTGRLTIQSRPIFVKYSGLPYVPKYQAAPTKNRWALDSLSLGITSIESCMMLNNISPNTRDDRPPHEYNFNPFKAMKFSSQAIWSEVTKIFVGLMCVVWMYCILIMYAECFGFIAEAFVMILMGAVVNAGSAANYIMLSFWAITYSVSCYNDTYEMYLALNAKIFEFLKTKLADNIKRLTYLREEKQRYTAFKYFTNEELQNEAQTEIEVDLESEDEVATVLGKSPLRQASQSKCYDDSIEYIKGKLHWKIHHLLLFVDKKDVPRIPRQLFEAICRIEAPGCPGPVYHGLLTATRKFLYMIIFLVFVVIVVTAFGMMYNVSTTNQLLVTLAGGLVPFVIRFVLKPKENSIDLNTYTFEGKVHEILKRFHQTWPVHDLTFTLDSNVEQDIPPTAGNSSLELGNTPVRAGNPPGDVIRTQPTPRQVDLLITIRDEDPDEPTINLRSEPGSLGSIASGNRLSPEVAYSPVRNLNNPANVNALIAHTPRHDATNQEESIPLNTLNRNVGSPANGSQGNVMTSQGPENDGAVAPVQMVVDICKNGVPEVRSVNSLEPHSDSDLDDPVSSPRSPSASKKDARNADETARML